LLTASLLAFFYAPQPVPVYSGTSTGGSSLPVCYYPPAPQGGTTVPGSYTCPPVDNGYQTALLAAAVCSALALLVLPAVIGFVSRRWQSALAAPALPLWAALLVLVGISLALQSSIYQGYGGNGLSSALAAWTQVLSVGGSVLAGLFLVTAFGGLGWLARRAFAR
jgi:hypothetical protein